MVFPPLISDRFAVQTRQTDGAEFQPTVGTSSKNPEKFGTKIRPIIQARGLLFPLDVLLVGPTGSGKSSTLNAIFGDVVSKVGDGVDPETQVISGFKVHDYLRIFDSAGLGDGLEADNRHAAAIREKLSQRCAPPQQGCGFIDLVLVILDGSSRDLGTAYRLLESAVVNSISADRIVVAINQADLALKGHNWNHKSHTPEQALVDFLDEKSTSVRRRVKESTGILIRRPVCYSAKYNWNIDKLVDHIAEAIPRSRRTLP